MRVAAAQLSAATLADATVRTEATVAAIAQAAAQGAELVVLPELAACGYVLDDQYLAGHAEPGDASGSVLRAWSAACAAHSIALVGGFAERDGDARYNSAIALDERGEVRGRYRKLHLFGAEHDVFAPGDLGLPVLDLAGHRIGLLICYDLRFPEAIRILALQGAELVAVPTAWIGGFDRPGRDPARPIGQLEAALVHANLNQVFIACASVCGASPELTFLGRSVVIDPYGDAVGGPLPADSPGMLVTDVDTATVTAALERGPGISPRRNRRVDIYAELLGYQRPPIQEQTT